MKLVIIQLFSLLFTALALAPALAHLLELPNKIGLSRDDYLTVQQMCKRSAGPHRSDCTYPGVLMHERSRQEI